MVVFLFDDPFFWVGFQFFSLGYIFNLIFFIFKLLVYDITSWDTLNIKYVTYLVWFFHIFNLWFMLLHLGGTLNIKFGIYVCQTTIFRGIR